MAAVVPSTYQTILIADFETMEVTEVPIASTNRTAASKAENRLAASAADETRLAESEADQ